PSKSHNPAKARKPQMTMKKGKLAEGPAFLFVQDLEFREFCRIAASRQLPHPEKKTQHGQQFDCCHGKVLNRAEGQGRSDDQYRQYEYDEPVQDTGFATTLVKCDEGECLLRLIWHFQRYYSEDSVGFVGYFGRF